MIARRQLLSGLATLAVAAPALADPPPERDRSVAENYQKDVPGEPYVLAGAMIGVNAALADVKRILLAFDRYKEVLPRVKQSRVVAENEDGTTDVYMRAPILHGLAYIHGTMRFEPTKAWQIKGIRIDGHLIKGGILKSWRGTWKAYPCGPTRTLLKIELLADFNLPVPVSAESVNRSLLWAARKAVTAVRDMAECGTSGVSGD